MAKEQGLRSRAAFKLSQIHRTCPTVLSGAKHAVLDLCAAPGGWTQIAARTCASSVRIVAVDLLPIRSFAASSSNRNNNITTLVGDITTDACQSDIRRTLAGSPVDVVLHDGAPNVGANYAKDAYVQNELAVHAAKCATRHLIPGGTFLTKVYRSRDYTALHWMLSQLFDTVTAVKPTASRPASAEIFLLCRHYKAPVHLDPRLLDPKYVFASVEDDPANKSSSNNPTNVFDKAWDKPVRRRGGYDMEHLDATMRHIEPVGLFVQAGWNDALRMLSTCTGLAFGCADCKNDNDDDNHNVAAATTTANCHCQFLLHHPFTTPEIKACVSDLQVLNKSDFKGLIGWRTKMQDALQATKKGEDGDDEGKMQLDAANDDDNSNSDAGAGDSEDSEKEEEEIQKEMEEMRARRQRESKRQKKKERAVTAKRRKQAALGMDLNAVDLAEHDQFFSLASIPSARALEAVQEVNLDHVTDEQLFGGPDDDGDVVVGELGSDDDSNDDNNNENDPDAKEERRRIRRERDLDEAYNQYLENTKDGLAVSGTKMAKRSKKAMRHKVAQEAEQDTEMAMTGEAGLSYDLKTYARMLKGDSDDEDDHDKMDGSAQDNDDDDDGFLADPMTPDEFAASKSKKNSMHQTKESNNPLIHRFADEPTSVKTARWFSNPLFATIGKSVEMATNNATSKSKKSAFIADHDDNDADNDSGSDDEDEVAELPSTSRKNKATASKALSKKSTTTDDSRSRTQRLTADDVLASMPRTDKQVRHEKRLKQMERQERKKARVAKKIGETESEFQQVAADPTSDDSDDDDNAKGRSNQSDRQSMDHLSDAQKKRLADARKLIKAGMGQMGPSGSGDASSSIEIVSQEESQRLSGKKRPLPIIDERKYDSENEDYDSDDYARTLALGTMMLRRSKEKAFVDASYNRYAWNDPSDLPEWFVDDENKNYKPQLPIPPALLAKMKEKMMALSAKPIAKVAEARARKSKRAKMKLAAAKKQAEAVANSTEMTEAMKLKAISKALTRSDDKKKSSGKQYVVAKKGRGSSGGGVKGAKVVDKRQKSDKRATDRIERKRKKGKQNGLVGSKKRHHHR